MIKGKRNNRGFSMIELLGTIAILGILSTVAIISIGKLREKARINHYKNQTSNIMSAAQNYAGDNSSFLPKNIGQRVSIKLEDLINAKYIKEIKDYTKQDCENSHSMVHIYKYAKDKYTYIVDLVCPDYKTDYKRIYEMGPDVVISEDINSASEPVLNINITARTEDDGIGTLSTKNKIATYKYILYKAKVNTAALPDADGDYTYFDYVEIQNSGDVEAGVVDKVELRGDKGIRLVLDPGEKTAKFKLKVIAVDIYGNSKIDEFEQPLIDNEGPECPTVPEFISEIYTNVSVNGIDDITMNSYDEWTKNDRKVTIKCIGDCERQLYTQTFTTEEAYGTIEMKDLVGNTSVCTVPINIDKTPPTIHSLVNSYGSRWASSEDDLSANPYTLTINATDNIGIRDYSYNYPNSAPTKVKYLNSQDKEEFITTPFTINRNENVQIEVCDYAGNCVDILEPIKIDTIAPTLSINNPFLYTWPSQYAIDNDYYKLTLSAYESTNGSGIKGYSYKYTGEEETPYANSNYSVFTTTPFKRERKEDVIIKVCDNAGNCSSQTSFIQIDLTPPTVPEVITTYDYDSTKSEGNKAKIYESGDTLSLYTGKVFLADKRYSSIGYATSSDPNPTIASGLYRIQVSKDGINWENYSYDESNDLYYAMGDGVHYRYLRAMDRAGNISDNNENKIIIDSGTSTLTCPTYTVKRKDNNASVSRQTWVNSELWLNYDFSATGATTYSFYTNDSGSWTNWYQDRAVPTSFLVQEDLNADGQRQAKMIISDGINTKECSTNLYYIDKTEPTCTATISGTMGTNNWYKTSVNVSLTKNDALSGVASYGLATTSNTYNSKTSATQGNTSGITYYGVVKDRAGNVKPCNTGSFKVDTTPPSCSITATGTTGENSWFTSNVTVKLVPSGASNYELRTTNSARYNGTAQLTQSSNTSGTTYYGFVKDAAGHTATCSKTIKVDKTNPPCNLVVKSGTLGDNGWYKSNVTVGFSSLSGVTNKGITTSNSVSYNGKTERTRESDTGASGGTYYGWTKDSSGRTSSCSITIKKDATLPTASITLAAGTYKKMQPVKLTCSDAQSGVAVTKIKFDGVTYNDSDDGSTNNKAGFNFLKAASNKKATFTCKDKAGNVKKVERYYTVQNQCPEGSTIFGSARNNPSSANTASSTDSRTYNFSGKWCNSNGKSCDAPYGWMRKCVSSWCSGMTAEQINTKYNCGYVRFWCNC